jgi:DNA-directed RNA polymerase subunit L
MKTKLILTIFTTFVLVGGCGSYKTGPLSNECINCQKLKDTLKYFKEEEHAEKIILAEFKDEYESKDSGEIPWDDFEKIILKSAGCCASSPNPLSKEWQEYSWLDCIRGYLEKENIQRIAFYGHVNNRDKPEDWHGVWAEIAEPQKIEEALKLLLDAVDKEKDRFANWEIVVGHNARMQIVTDRHKFIIPISCGSSEDEEVCGLGWSSCKLRKKLTDWGLAEPVPEKEDRALGCVWESLEKENIRKIDFCQYTMEHKVDQGGHTYPSLGFRPYGEITEPQKISKVLDLLREALKRGENRIEDGKTYDKLQMQIVTDKHKYLIRVFLDKEAVYGAGWTSNELREKLAEWGFLKT